MLCACSCSTVYFVVYCAGGYNFTDKTLVCDRSNDQVCHVVLFIMLYKVVLIFKSIYESHSA